jgi:hypothetical protein
MKKAMRIAAAGVALAAAALGAAAVTQAQPILEVTITPQALECGGGAAFVFVEATDATGAPTDAGTVTFSTTLGTIVTNPVTDTEPFGSLVTILAAPADEAGIVTVTATSSLGASDSASAVVTCKPAAKDLCQDGGWETATRADGSGFKSPGDCLQYFSKGK